MEGSDLIRKIVFDSDRTGSSRTGCPRSSKSLQTWGSQKPEEPALNSV